MSGHLKKVPGPGLGVMSDDAVLQFQVFPELFKAMRPSHWGLVLENPQSVEKKAFPLFDSATYRKKKETPPPPRTVNND